MSELFSKLRAVLNDYYPSNTAPDIVGYLRGSKDRRVWRNMLQSNREQMLILGSVPPTDQQWEQAGVSKRQGEVQVIRLDDLDPYIITYGGFMVSRPWGKISVLTEQTYRSYGMVLAQFQRALPKKTAQGNEALTALANLIDAVGREAERVSGEHKAEAGLLTGSQGNFSGFWGYWTNQLFNKDVPPIAIWNDCWSALMHARSTFREGKYGEAAKSMIRARASLLKASGVYYRWKNGIEAAGRKMKISIGVVSVALIAAAVTATVASGAAAAGGTEAASAGQAVEELTGTVNKLDTTLQRLVETPSGGTTAPLATSVEQGIDTAAEEIQEIYETFEAKAG